MTLAIALAPQIRSRVTGSEAAVTAAFMFRDEIFQAIGIDFVGIMEDAVNAVIGAFVGAFNGIKDTWSLLPAAMGDITNQAAQATLDGVVSMINKVRTELIQFLQWVAPALSAIPGGGAISMSLSGMLAQGELKAPEVGNVYAGAAAKVAGDVSSAMQSALSTDYVGKIAESLGFVGNEAETDGAKITGLGAALDGGDGEGGAAGGARKLGAATDETGGKLKNLKDIGESVSSTLQDGFKDLFKGMITGSGNAMDAISNLLGKLADMLTDQGFQMLFSGFGGGGAGGFLGGIGKLFGFARGGTIMPGGSGGIDSQLVTFRKSPNERVDITKPGQSLSGGGGGALMVDVKVGVDETGNLMPFVTRVSGQVAGQAVRSNNKQIPNIMRDHGLRSG